MCRTCRFPPRKRAKRVDSAEEQHRIATVREPVPEETIQEINNFLASQRWDLLCQKCEGGPIDWYKNTGKKADVFSWARNGMSFWKVRGVVKKMARFCEKCSDTSKVQTSLPKGLYNLKGRAMKEKDPVKRAKLWRLVTIKQIQWKRESEAAQLLEEKRIQEILYGENPPISKSALKAFQDHAGADGEAVERPAFYGELDE